MSAIAFARAFAESQAGDDDDDASLAEAAHFVTSTRPSSGWMPKRGVRVGPLQALLVPALYADRQTLAVQEVKVDPEHREQGHFTRFIERLHALNPSSHTLVTDVTNPVLSQFLERGGWERSDEHEGYARSTSLPAFD